MIDPAGFNEMKQCRYGPMVYNKNDWPIGLSLQQYGEYAWAELEPMQSVIKPGQLVVDIGANIGTHTVLFSQLVGPSGFVVSFEPQRVSFQTLCANCAINNCTNVIAFWKAIGAKNDTIIVPVRDQYARNNFGGVQLAGVTEGDTVELVTLDSLNLSMCNLIKADIEGMEAEFLEGAQKTIARHRPILYIEGDGAQAKEAIRMLWAMGYKLMWHCPALFNPRNFAGKKENIFSENGSEVLSVNILCVPMETAVEVPGLRVIQSADEEPLTIENERRMASNREVVLA